MPHFLADCSSPDNFGCSKRCALYLIITYNCVQDAYDLAARAFNASCVACNMCWDKSNEPTRRAVQLAPYARVWARGPSGALFVNHWLVSRSVSSACTTVTPYCCPFSQCRLHVGIIAYKGRLASMYTLGLLGVNVRCVWVPPAMLQPGTPVSAMPSPLPACATDTVTNNYSPGRQQAV